LYNNPFFQRLFAARRQANYTRFPLAAAFFFRFDLGCFGWTVEDSYQYTNNHRRESKKREEIRFGKGKIKQSGEYY